MSDHRPTTNGVTESDRGLDERLRRLMQPPPDEHLAQIAHRAIQESVGKRLKHRPETLTMPEVETILDECNAGNDVRESIREFFEAADSIKFAGSPARNYDLRGREKALVNLLNTLESLR